jgi:orotate phosphoribosyltransferase
VLLLDDTWTTGASAQSAAMALRRAGAASVATVVLGRHVAARPAAAAPFNPRHCAVHAACGDGG